MSSSNKPNPTLAGLPAPSNDSLKGMAWLALSGIIFSIFVAIIRNISLEMAAAETAFLRYLFGLLFLLPLFMGRRRRELRTKRPWSQALRGLLHGFGVLLWFYAIAEITLAEVTALGFTAPVFSTIGAAIFLGERIHLPRMLAVVLGLAGAVIILQPGFREVTLGHIAMLVAAPCFAASKIIAKKLTFDENPTAIVAWLSITVTIVLAIPAIQVWRTPTLEEFVLLAATAGLATLAHICMTKAWQAADLSVTQPVEFMQLIWATLIGIYLFGEQPFWGIWVGGAIIIASATFIAHREMLARKRQSS